MKLKDYAKNIEELEVWDENVDIKQPVYVYCDMNLYDDGDLHILEEWFMNLEVTTIMPHSACVDVFSEISNRWHNIYSRMKTDPSFANFVSEYDEDDDEGIALFTEDIFTTLAVGFKRMAKNILDYLGD